MAQKQARLVVLGSKDFEGFTELDDLPESVEIVGLGSADEILGGMLLQRHPVVAQFPCQDFSLA